MRRLSTAGAPRIFSFDGSSSTTITFLPTTPSDGVVEVRVASLPPFTQTLFTPCGG